MDFDLLRLKWQSVLKQKKRTFASEASQPRRKVDHCFPREDRTSKEKILQLSVLTRFVPATISGNGCRTPSVRSTLSKKTLQVHFDAESSSVKTGRGKKAVYPICAVDKNTCGKIRSQNWKFGSAAIKRNDEANVAKRYQKPNDADNWWCRTDIFRPRISSQTYNFLFAISHVLGERRPK